MPYFSSKSMSRLNTCEQDIQTILLEAIKIMDCTIIFGHRSPQEQFELFKKGRKLRNDIWIIENDNEVVTEKDGTKNKSKHNFYPSKAIDIFPWPLPNPWPHHRENTNIPMLLSLRKVYELAGVIRATQSRLMAEGTIRHTLDWGGELWKSFFDWPHWQINPRIGV